MHFTWQQKLEIKIWRSSMPSKPSRQSRSVYAGAWGNGVTTELQECNGISARTDLKVSESSHAVLWKRMGGVGKSYLCTQIFTHEHSICKASRFYQSQADESDFDGLNIMSTVPAQAVDMPITFGTTSGADGAIYPLERNRRTLARK